MRRGLQVKLISQGKPISIDYYVAYRSLRFRGSIGRITSELEQESLTPVPRSPFAHQHPAARTTATLGSTALAYPPASLVTE